MDFNKLLQQWFYSRHAAKKQFYNTICPQYSKYKHTNYMYFQMWHCGSMLSLSQQAIIVTGRMLP